MASSYIVFKVDKAVLEKKLKVLYGKISPYARITLNSSNGDTDLLSETPPHTEGSLKPIWNFTCTVNRALYSRYDYISIDVNSKMVSVSGRNIPNMSMKDFKVGFAKIKIASLTSRMGCSKQKLKLCDSNGEEVGSLYISWTFTDLHEDEITDMQSLVDPSLFHTPVKRLGVSGGTAPFFELILKNPSENQSSRYYIGKDLSRAADEFVFYEKINELKRKKHVDGLNDILSFSFEYAGVLKTLEYGQEDQPEKKLLVMRNLHDSCKKLRLLDLKIGYRTADAGWHGKTWLAATRQKALIDSTTNTLIEGFRLEGFDGLPKSLLSMDPCEDPYFLEFAINKAKVEKKARRHFLQCLTGVDIMPYYLDLSCLDMEMEKNGKNYYFPCEVSELVQLETVQRLTNLAITCLHAPSPQKWVGSSVALGYDCGTLPLRSISEKEIRERVIVNIFDWGRSTLKTAKEYDDMTIHDQKDYKKFWQYYTKGVVSLAWDAAHYYFHRFGNTRFWKDFSIVIKDYDAMSKNDMIGTVILPVKKLEKETFQIVHRGRNRGTLTCSLEWKSYPCESRLEGVWRIVIHNANKIPNMDTGSLSDAYCEICASSDFGHKFVQYSSVIHNNLNPVWNESFEIPIMKSSTHLSLALNRVGVEINEQESCMMFSQRKMVRSLLHFSDLKIQGEFIEKWRKMLKSAKPRKL